jgi:hypothetical protein
MDLVLVPLQSKFFSRQIFLLFLENFGKGNSGGKKFTLQKSDRFSVDN